MKQQITVTRRAGTARGDDESESLYAETNDSRAVDLGTDSEATDNPGRNVKSVRGWGASFGEG